MVNYLIKISYDISKQLKEIGFYEKCIIGYDSCQMLFYSEQKNGYFLNYSIGNNINAPTIQQTIQWFNETHNLEIMVKSWIESKEIIYMYSVNKLGSPSNYDNKFKTKSEATELGILKAIELIKNKQK